MGIAIAPAKVAVLVVLLLIGHDWSQEASLSRRGSDVAIAYEYALGVLKRLFPLTACIVARVGAASV